MITKYLRVALAATLVLAVTSPAFAQQPAGPYIEPKLALTFTGTFFTGTFIPGEGSLVTFAYAYVNVTTVSGSSWQIGVAPFTLGLVGLLFDADPTGGHVKATFPVLGVDLTGMVIRGGDPALSTDTVWILRAEPSILDAVVGLSYMGEVASGAWSSGWAVDVSREMLPGLSLEGEYASFTSPLVGGPTTAYYAQAVLNLDALFGVEAFSPFLTLAYRDADPFFFGAAPAFTNVDDWAGWSAELGLTLSPSLEATFTYETGTFISGFERRGLVAEFVSPLAANTELTLTYTYNTDDGFEAENKIEVKVLYELF